MSIINDALKKVQTNMGQNNNPQEPPSVTPMGTPPSGNKPENPPPPPPPTLPTVEIKTFETNSVPWTEHPKAPWEVGNPNAAAPQSPPPQPTPPPVAPQPQVTPTQAPHPSSARSKINRTTPGSILFLLILLAALTMVLLKISPASVFEKIAAQVAKIKSKYSQPKKAKSAYSTPTPAPTQPPPEMGIPAAASPKAATVVVNGIMTSAGKKVALINNKVYAEGQDVNGMKILHISFDRVVVLDQGVEKSFDVHNNDGFTP